MDRCSSTKPTLTAFETNQGIDQAAEALANLLEQAPEYQEFARLASLINLDPDVKRTLLEIRHRQMMYRSTSEKSVETLQSELETLPAMQAYHKAETALKDLFHSVDQVISAAAGVEFAPNALNSACG
jgi:cell fate (sporulation/competence/biofilm development) regulator YlbF (YheA/YmcA/DUF963 family)